MRDISDKKKQLITQLKVSYSKYRDAQIAYLKTTYFDDEGFYVSEREDVRRLERLRDEFVAAQEAFREYLEKEAGENGEG